MRARRKQFLRWWRREGGGGTKGSVIVTLRVYVDVVDDDNDKQAVIESLRTHPHVREAAAAATSTTTVSSSSQSYFDVVVDATAGVEPSALVASVRMALAQKRGVRMMTTTSDESDDIPSPPRQKEKETSSSSRIPRVQILPAFGAGSSGIEHGPRAASIVFTIESKDNINSSSRACACDGQNVISSIPESDVIATSGRHACVVVRETCECPACPNDSSSVHEKKKEKEGGASTNLFERVGRAISASVNQSSSSSQHQGKTEVATKIGHGGSGGDDDDDDDSTNITMPLLPSPNDDEDDEVVTIRIRGMECGSCAAWMRDALQRVPGVEKVDISLSSGTAVVRTGHPRPSLEDLAESVYLAGYDLAREASQHFELHGGGAAHEKGWWSRLSSFGKSSSSRGMPVDGGNDEEAPPMPPPPARNNQKTTTGSSSVLKFAVLGMTCGSCVHAVKNALIASHLPGFPLTTEDVALDSVSGNGRVVLTDASAFLAANGIAEMASAVSAAGYEAVNVEIEIDDVGVDDNLDAAAMSSKERIVVRLYVDGIVCASCPPRIENAVRRNLAKRGIVDESSRDAAAIDTEDYVQIDDVRVDYVTSELLVHFRIHGNAAAVAAITDEEEEETKQGMSAVHRVDPQRSLEWQVATIVNNLGYGAYPWQRGGGRVGTAIRTTRNSEWVSNACYAVALAIVELAILLLQHRCEYEASQEEDARKHDEKFAAQDCVILSSHAQFLLATMQLLGPAGIFWFVRAWRAFRHGSANMATLVVLGAGTAYLYSVVVLFSTDWAWGKQLRHDDEHQHHHEPPASWHISHGMLMFDCAIFTVAIVTVGKCFEEYAKAESVDAASKLSKLLDGPATLLWQYRPSSTAAAAPSSVLEAALDATCVVDTSFVKPGDLIRAKAGERIVVDGVVVGIGTSAVDERVITGESVPRPVGMGSVVIGGAVNVGDEPVFYRATASKTSSYLQTIATAVDEARMSTGSSAGRIADRWAARFAPLIIFTALAALVGWMIRARVTCSSESTSHMCKAPVSWALHFAVATVVSACPCALGLASPSAVSVGAWVAAKRGIFVKGGSGLEDAASVKKVVFDKTGTLTTGELTVATTMWLAKKKSSAAAAEEIVATTSSSSSSFQPFAREADAWHLVHLAEESSSHPIAIALARYAATFPLSANTAEDVAGGEQPYVRNLPGLGTFVRVNGWSALVGNRSLMRRANVVVPSLGEDELEEGFGVAVTSEDAERRAARGVVTASDSEMLPSMPLHATTPGTPQHGVLPGAHCTPVYVAIARATLETNTTTSVSPEEEAWFRWLRDADDVGGGCGGGGAAAEGHHHDDVKKSSVVPLTIASVDGESAFSTCLVIGMTDALREESHAAVAALCDMGIESYLCTGDQMGAALHVARLAGIAPSRVVYGASPTRKAEFLRGLERSAPVAFVGDGVNDAIAIASATFGIAVGGATDIATSAARCVVTSTNLMHVPEALRIARKTMAQIRFNIAEAVLYNLAVVPLAAGAYWDLLHWSLSATVGAILMSCSSLLVMATSLTLLWVLRF